MVMKVEKLAKMDKDKLNLLYVDSVKELKKEQKSLDNQSQVIDAKIKELIKKNGR